MKFLLTLAFIIALPSTYAEEKQAQPSTNKNQTDVSKPLEPRTPPATPTKNEVTQLRSVQTDNLAKNQEKGYCSRLFSPENLPNIGLFIAGIGAIVVAIFTLKAIRKQTGAVLRSVLAAERSTGVLMQAERGRIVIYWDQIAHIDYGPTRIINGPLLHCFNWHCRNAGRTQIELIQTWSKLIAIDSLIALPENPDYSSPNGRPYVGEPLQPNVGEQHSGWFSTILETSLSFEEIQAKHRSGKCALYAYGFVEYRDIWGQSHVHRFGVVRAISTSLMTDNWVPAGPRPYNSSD